MSTGEADDSAEYRDCDSHKRPRTDFMPSSATDHVDILTKEKDEDNMAASSSANSDSAETEEVRCDEERTISNKGADASALRNLAASEEDASITFRTFTNNGTDESSTALIALKNIFSRQLPKMPKDYIVRLVFDRRHISLAILRMGRIIGGVCYRPYMEQRFGEIAFCAVSGSEQVKGYGTLLLNHLKTHVQKDRLEYFLTYADNYAIGYFQKQGFSKTISMPNKRWVGFIKDYDGGTLMECYIHPALDYLNVPQIVAAQRAFIYNRLKERSQSGTVYPGLEIFQLGKRLQSVLEAPGVQSGGWTTGCLFKNTTERDRDNAHARLCATLKTFMERIRACPHSWPFKEELPTTPEYYEVVKNPLTLETLAFRLKMGDYYRNKECLLSDITLMVDNCKAFCSSDSSYMAACAGLESFVADLFRDPVTRDDKPEGERERGGGGGRQSRGGEGGGD